MTYSKFDDLNTGERFILVQDLGPSPCCSYTKIETVYNRETVEVANAIRNWNGELVKVDHQANVITVI